MNQTAGDTLQSGPEEQGETSGEDTYFLPAGAVEGKDVKPGDIIKFKVVGEDKDGNVEVSCVDDSDKGKGGMSWQDEMRKTVPPSGPNGSY